MSSRSAPRPLAAVLGRARGALAPRTPLARVQATWLGAVGERIAAAAAPVSEHRGVITVSCESAVWAEQLDLMQTEILARLRDRDPANAAIAGLRFRTHLP